MKKQVLVFLILVFLWVTPILADEPDYFPLQVGNRWVYEYYAQYGDIVSYSPMKPLAVIGTKSIGGKTYFMLSGAASIFLFNPIDTILVRKAEDDINQIFRRVGDREVLWYNFHPSDPTISSWDVMLPWESGDIILWKYSFSVSDIRSINVPAGSFESVASYRVYPTNEEELTTEELWAPNVGLVAVFLPLLDPSCIYRLVEAEVNGVIYPKRSTAVPSSNWGQVKAEYK